MPDAVANPVGGIVRSLPMGEMISVPLLAVADAQRALAKSTADFINEVGFVKDKDGKTYCKMVRGVVRRSAKNAQGEPTGVVEEVSADAPILCMSPIPTLAIKRAKIEFELTVDTTESSESESKVEGSAEGKVGWGVFSASFKASASHRSAQTRKTDTRARYAFSVEAEATDPPEGLMRFLDFLLNAASDPVPAASAPPLPAAA